jgi:hypothetical protein
MLKEQPIEYDQHKQDNWEKTWGAMQSYLDNNKQVYDRLKEEDRREMSKTV